MCVVLYLLFRKALPLMEEGASIILYVSVQRIYQGNLLKSHLGRVRDYSEKPDRPFLPSSVVLMEISALTIIYVQYGMGGQSPSSAGGMIDDSEGKAIGSGDCHMTPIREGPVSGPIRRLQFFDPVLRRLPRFLQAISPEYCLVKGG
jgi:hypothetical protein